MAEYDDYKMPSDGRKDIDSIATNTTVPPMAEKTWTREEIEEIVNGVLWQFKDASHAQLMVFDRAFDKHDYIGVARCFQSKLLAALRKEAK